MAAYSQQGFIGFVRGWVIGNVTPLPSSVDVSVDTWLAGSNYTIKRREALRVLASDIERKGLPWNAHEVLSFIKDEPYSTFKHCRGIYSRRDAYKVRFGPWFKVLENALFSLKWFIKKHPVLDRPRLLRDMFPNYGYVDRDDQFVERIVNTDYSSFEGSFVPDNFDVEFVLYRWLLQNVPGGPEFCDEAERILKGENHLIFKWFRARVIGLRMSGEMNTSLGNSFFNLMKFAHIMHCMGITDYDVLVEGDDLLARFVGPKINPLFYELSGLIVKIIYVSRPGEASFCGQLFDDDSLTVIADPVKVMLNFGYTHFRYVGCSHRVRMELIRAKAMSILALHAGCPILQQLAQTFIRLTDGYRYRLETVNKWKLTVLRDLLKQTLKPRPVSFSSRIFFEQQFGITIAEQFDIEASLRAIHRIEPIDIPLFLDSCSREQVQAYEMYCHDVRVADAESGICPIAFFDAL